MLIPVRCMTCGHVIGALGDIYEKRVSELESEKKPVNFVETAKKEILDDLGLKKMCCRRMMLGYVDIFDKL